ncbi:MAG: hypothetical protein ACE1ZE_03970 [Candidatus Binatia bacterium]
MKLEGTLANIEKESEALLKMVAEAARAVRRVRSAAKVGDLLKLRKALEAADQSCLCLRNEMVTAAKAWELDDVAYLSGKGFQEELLDMARQMDVDLIEQDGALVAYPTSVRILPQDRKVAIDRTQETGLRPSVLIKRLKEAQSKPPRFTPQFFLEIVFSAYSIAVAMRGKPIVRSGPVVPFLEIYNLLTVFPHRPVPYTRQEFARDLYTLDGSGVTRTRKGNRLHFHGSTGIRDAKKPLRVMTREGGVRTYYGTSFSSSG